VATAFSAGVIKSVAAESKCEGGQLSKIAHNSAAEGGIGTIQYQWARDGSTTYTTDANVAEYTPVLSTLANGAHVFTRQARDGNNGQCSGGWKNSTNTRTVNVYKKPTFSNIANLTQSKTVGQVISPISITVSNASAAPSASGTTVTGLNYSYNTANSLAVSGTVGQAVGQKQLTLIYKNTLDGCNSNPIVVNITANGVTGGGSDQILYDGVVIWNFGRVTRKACAEKAAEIVSSAWNLLSCNGDNYYVKKHSNQAIQDYHTKYLIPQGVDALLCVQPNVWYAWCCWPNTMSWINVSSGDGTGYTGACLFEHAIPQ
jgi:hypothetical protein